MNIYRTYLMTALSLGFTGHVYRMVGKWGSQLYGDSPKKGDAAWAASEELVKNHSFHKCPSCTWATREKDEHLTGGSWCHEEHTLQTTGFSLDDIEEMQRNSNDTHGWDIAGLGDRWAPPQNVDDYPTEPEVHPAIAERAYNVQSERLMDGVPGTPVDQLLGEDRWNQLH
jgi:hypothetical protein